MKVKYVEICFYSTLSEEELSTLQSELSNIYDKYNNSYPISFYVGKEDEL